MKPAQSFAFAIFFIFLSVPYSVAESQDDLFYSGELTLNLHMNSNFSLLAKKSGSKIDYVRAYLNFFPEDTYRQRIVSLVPEPLAEIKNDTIEYNWEKPGFGQFSYGLSSEIKTTNEFIKIHGKIPFPINSLPPEIIEFTQPTDKIDITPEIIAQASELANGEDDLFQVVFNLASWTKKNINYSLDTFTADASQKASWVLANRYGVCDELTNLFIAMNRALGIPARFVTGVSYTNSEFFEEKWGLHGWAEVYFPDYGWVPIDPTYGQYGQVDATHIKLRDSADSDKSSTRFEWESYEVDLIPGSITNQIDILKIGDKFSSPVEMKIIPFSNEVPFGSYDLIEISMENKADYYVGFDLALSKPAEVAVINEKFKYVLLKPDEKKSVYYIIKIDSNLKKNYIYTFPLSIQNSLGGNEEGSVKSRSGGVEYTLSQVTTIMNQLKEEDTKTYSKNIDFMCEGPANVYANESFALGCTVANLGNIFLENLRVCINANECQQFDLGISRSKNINFTLFYPDSGAKQITLSARNKDVSKFVPFNANVLDKPAIIIDKIEYPEIIKINEPFEIKFDIMKRSISTPENSTVFFSFNGQETSWKPDIESTQGFDVKIERDLLDPKNNTFEIKVIFHDKSNHQYIETYTKQLALEDATFFQKIILYFNKFSRDLQKLLTG